MLRRSFVVSGTAFLGIGVTYSTFHELSQHCEIVIELKIWVSGIESAGATSLTIFEKISPCTMDLGFLNFLSLLTTLVSEKNGKKQGQ